MAKKAAPKAAEPKAAAASSEKTASPEPRARSSPSWHEPGLSKKQISTVFDGLTELIKHELGKKGPGLFVVPGLSS